MEKCCSRCFQTKPLGLFPKAKTCKDGYRSYCKLCEKARKDTWRKSNKEHHNAKGKAWASTNREKRLEICKKYNTKYVLSGASKKAKTKWRAANAEKARAYVNARRAKVKQATPKWVDIAELTKVYERAQKLGLTVDHIVPIKHDLICGLHVPWNLQLLSAKENYAKSNLFGGIRSR